MKLEDIKQTMPSHSLAFQSFIYKTKDYEFKMRSSIYANQLWNFTLKIHSAAKRAGLGNYLQCKELFQTVRFKCWGLLFRHIKYQKNIYLMWNVHFLKTIFFMFNSLERSLKNLLMYTFSTHHQQFLITDDASQKIHKGINAADQI